MSAKLKIILKSTLVFEIDIANLILFGQPTFSTKVTNKELYGTHRSNTIVFSKFLPK